MQTPEDANPDLEYSQCRNAKIITTYKILILSSNWTLNQLLPWNMKFYPATAAHTTIQNGVPCPQRGKRKGGQMQKSQWQILWQSTQYRASRVSPMGGREKDKMQPDLYMRHAWLAENVFEVFSQIWFDKLDLYDYKTCCKLLFVDAAHQVTSDALTSMK